MTKTTDYLVKSITKMASSGHTRLTRPNWLKKAHEIHDTWSASSAALGRTLIGTVLLATAGLEARPG